MGLFFTLLYIFLAYLTPAAVFGEAAASTLHVQEIIAVPTIFCSFLALKSSGVTRMNQAYAVIGLLTAVIFSSILTGWFGGVLGVFVGLLPNLLTFFFVAINCRKKVHLQALVAVLCFVSIVVIFQSQLEERSGREKGDYFISMRSDTGESFYRITGRGVINDPNDLGQYLIAVIPCVLFFWVKGKAMLNGVRVYLPVSILTYGLYLTHSRGALVALAAVCVIAGRRKLGVIPSLISGGVLFLGLIATGFTGGRDISAANGEDRMEAWGAGLQMLRSHPIFGVGANQFTEYHSLTAHNSIVICAAETGFVGLFFWTLFIFSGLRESWVVSEAGRSTKQKDTQADPFPTGILASRASHPVLAGIPFTAPKLASVSMNPDTLQRVRPEISSGLSNANLGMQAKTSQAYAGPYFKPPETNIVSVEEIQRMATLMLLSLVGLLTAGWFLSRAFSMVIYLFGGMAAAIFRMAQESGMDIPTLPLLRAMKINLIPTFALAATVYAILRVTNMLGH